jgi:hypothetical protein
LYRNKVIRWTNDSQQRRTRTRSARYLNTEFDAKSLRAQSPRDSGSHERRLHFMRRLLRSAISLCGAKLGRRRRV